MRLRKIGLTIALVLGIARGTSFAVPMGTLTWRTESSAGQFCVLGTYGDAAYDVFGTSINLGAIGDIFCSGTVTPPVITGHCEAVAGASTLSYDLTTAFDGAGPQPEVPWPFVLDITNLTGSAVSGLSNLSYTFDGVHTQRATGFPNTTIPGCPIVGEVTVADGTGGSNAFQAVATGTGSDVPVNTTVSFTDPNTGEPQSASVNLVFDNVTSGGNTTVTVTSSEPGTVASNFAVAVGGYTAVYLEISTTATFTGPIEICGQYEDADNDGILDGTSVPETALRFLHGEGMPVAFVDRTSRQDTDANTLCAEVTSLSPFVMAVDVGTQSSHDSVVLAVKPLSVSIDDGATAETKSLKVKVFNADTTEVAGHQTKLAISASTCPDSVLLDAMNQPVAPDFDKATAGANDSIVIAGGKSAAAVLPLTFKATDFSSPSAKAPARCTLTITATTINAGTVIDPSPTNNSVRVDLNVVDNNDF